MKSTFHGNIPNMNGKKTYVLGCQCCKAVNKKEGYEKEVARREIRAWIADEPDTRPDVGRQAY